MPNDIQLDIPDLKVVVEKPDHYHVLLQNNAYKTILQNPEQYLVRLSQPGATVVGLPLSAVFAISSSYALTGSYAITSSYSVTSSYAMNAGASFPYTGSAQISGSAGVTGSFSVGSGLNCVLAVDPAGKVGVNICSPLYELHVSGAIFATGDVTAFSDRRVKTNIQPIWSAMYKVQQLRGVTFTRSDAVGEEAERRQMGFIAQEVQEVIPEVVVGTELNGYGVNYGNITALLVEAIKELKKEVDEIRYEL